MSPVLARPTVVSERADLDEALRARREARQRVALVPTMGALHAGHLALVEAARDHVGPDGIVCVSIFVNPLQFGAREDLASYPRSARSDIEACGAAGVDLVWTPTVSDVYPDPASGIAVHPGPLGAQLEGAVRPTHFAGVLTVVATLLGAVDPHIVVFGEKDFQQLVLVRAMVRSLALDVEVVAVPTHREADGLARSSRNAYLDAQERRQAVVVPQALEAGTHAAPQGRHAVLAAVHDAFEAAAVRVDYIALRTPDLRSQAHVGPARLLVAVRLGDTRLIDNVALDLPAPAEAAHRPTNQEIA